MNYNELYEINYGKPSLDLLNKILSECKGIILFYKEQLKNDKKPYWKGKIGNKTKEIKLIENKIKEIYG